jgi:hypothetical protein
MSDNGLVSRIFKELLQFNNKKTNSPIITLAKDLNRHFFNRDMQMTNENMKRYLTSFVTMEMQMKTPVSYHVISSEIVIAII